MLLLSLRGEQYYGKKYAHGKSKPFNYMYSRFCIIILFKQIQIEENKTENGIKISTFKVNFVMPESFEQIFLSRC